MSPVVATPLALTQLVPSVIKVMIPTLHLELVAVGSMVHSHLDM
jgi:hypothetical protein